MTYVPPPLTAGPDQRSSVVKRSGWTLLDQVLSSLSNFLVSLLVLQHTAPRQFGAFALGLTIYQFVVYISRSFASDPLVMFSSTAGAQRWRSDCRAAVGTALAIGLVVGGVLLALSILARGDLGAVLVALSICLPGLLLQDAWRFAFFAAGAPAKAAANDLIWVVTLLVFFALVSRSEDPSLFAMVVAWGGAATLAAICGIAQTKVLPRPLLLSAWIRQHAAVSVRLATETMCKGGSLQLALFLVAALGGLATIGSLRAAQLLFGPLYIVFQGSTAFAVAEGVRLYHREPGRLWPVARTGAVVLGALGLAWGLMLMLLPGRIGVTLLRESWPEARTLIPALTILVVAAGALVAFDAGLRAIGAVRRMLLVSAILAPTVVASMALGAWLGGAGGAAAGQALSNVLWCGFAAQQLHSGWRRRADLRLGSSSP